jgi:peptidoglycan/xylan/chitin deacetylase (PgdA/CDA1 family)
MDYQPGDYFSNADMNCIKRQSEGFGVLAGLTLTPSASNLNVTIDTGTAIIGYGTYSSHIIFSTSNTITLISNLYNPRKGIIYIDSNGVMTVSFSSASAAVPDGKIGRQTEIPLAPTIPSDSTQIAEVWIPAGATIGSQLTIYPVDKILDIPTQIDYQEFPNYIAWKEGSSYKVKDLTINDVVVTQSTYDNMINAMESLSGFSTGEKVVLDKAWDYGNYPHQIWHYWEGNLFLPDLMIRDQIEWKPKRVLSLFDEGVNASGSWQDEGSSCSDDTTNFQWGKRGMKIPTTNGGGSSLRMTWTSTLNLSENGYFVLRYYVPDLTLFDQFRVTIGSGNWPDNYLDAYYGTPTNWGGNWVEVHINKNAFSGGGGTVDWSAISNLRFVAYGHTTNSYVTLNYLGWHTSELGRSIVMFGVDDSINNVDTYLKPYMDKYGWKGYICLTFTGISTPDIPRLKTLKEQGWDFLMHGYDHDGWGTMSDNRLTKEIARWYHGMRKLGLGDNQWQLAAPPGGSEGFVNKRVLDRYFHFVRGANDYWYYEPFPFSSRFVINALAAGSYTPAQIKSQIDSAEQTNRVLILYWHNELGGAIWTDAECKSFVDYVATKSVDVLTFSELLSRKDAISKVNGPWWAVE